MSGRSAQAVSDWRRRAKQRLVEHHGGKCLDCGYEGPPFMYDFDHRDPDDKSFNVTSSTTTRAWASLLEESLKCDLVCANCHRFRTHRQRCSGCGHC